MLSLRLILRTERKFNTEFVHLMDKNDEVMTQNFTQDLVGHGGIGFRANRIAELAFHHRERGFHVAPLVVVLQELLLAEIKVVIHLRPSTTAKPLVCFP